MKHRPKYSVDTSIFIEGWVRHYPPDVFPTVWDLTDGLISDGIIVATEEVLLELEKQHDDVYEWAKSRDSMFVPIDEAIQQIVADILCKYPRLVDTRKNRSGADPFVIGLACVNGCAVVTAETATRNLEKPRIPDVCEALGIQCISTVEMFRNEGLQF